MLTYFVVFIWSIGVLVLVRNQAVYEVRIAFIWDDSHLDNYSNLPSYNDMLLHPRYWLLWTTAHWRAWLARRTTCTAN